MRTNASLCILWVLLMGPVYSGPAHAGGKPGLDHYTVYRLQTPFAEFNENISFDSDQFGLLDPLVVSRQEALVPVKQDGSAYVDSTRHLTSWWIFKTTDQWRLAVLNKFSGRPQDLVIKDAVRVLLPASKFEAGQDPLPIPDGVSHFLCFKVQAGDPVNVMVTLEDQFGRDEVTVTDPKWFCVPVRKMRAGEPPSTIYSDFSLTCYNVDEISVAGHQRWFMDQFLSNLDTLDHLDCLCVPSTKASQPVSLEENTWGRIKAIYR